jgi:hypothetical protein
MEILDDPTKKTHSLPSLTVLVFHKKVPLDEVNVEEHHPNQRTIKPRHEPHCKALVLRQILYEWFKRGNLQVYDSVGVQVMA